MLAQSSWRRARAGSSERRRWHMAVSPLCLKYLTCCLCLIATTIASIQHRTRHRTGFCAKCLRSYRNNATCVRPACERTCDKRSRGGGDHQRRVVHRGLPDNSSHLLPLSCALISLCFVCEIEKREGRSGIDPVNQSWNTKERKETRDATQRNARAPALAPAQDRKAR